MRMNKLNNQSGFSLFSIIAAVLVMGFLASVAVTKMSNGIENIQEKAAGIAAARSLSAMETQVYGVYRMEYAGPDVETAATFFNWYKTPYADWVDVAGSPLTDTLGASYQWTAGASVTGGTLVFSKDGADFDNPDYTLVLVRSDTVNGPSTWSVQ